MAKIPIVTDGDGYFKIEDTRYAKGSVNISPVGTGEYVTLNYSANGRDIGLALRSYKEFTIGGLDPVDRQDLLDWADENIYIRESDGKVDATAFSQNGNVLATQDGDEIRLDVNLKGVATPLIIIIGDDNAVGFANNADLSGADQGFRYNTLIYNSVSTDFEPLKIGTNNALGQSSPDSTLYHGFENGIASDVDVSGGWLTDQIFTMKAGYYGSTSADWVTGGQRAITFAAQYATVKQRMAQLGKIPLPLVVISMGVNDAATAPADFKTNVQSLITNVRSLVGFAPVVMPYNATAATDQHDFQLNELAASVKHLYRIGITGAGLKDAVRFNAAGAKLIGQRIATFFRKEIGQGMAYVLKQNAVIMAPAGVPSLPGPYTLFEDKPFTAGGNGWNIIKNNSSNIAAIEGGRLHLKCIQAANAYALAAKDYLVGANEVLLMEVLGVEVVSGVPKAGIYDGNPQPKFTLVNGDNRNYFRTVAPVTAGSGIIDCPQPDAGEVYVQRIKYYRATGYTTNL